MANIKIVSVVGRKVTVDVTWANGLQRLGAVVEGVPIEKFEDAQIYLNDFISGWYEEEVRRAEQHALASPTIDPRIASAVGHTFKDDGTMIS